MIAMFLFGVGSLFIPCLLLIDSSIPPLLGEPLASGGTRS